MKFQVRIHSLATIISCFFFNGLFADCPNIAGDYSGVGSGFGKIVVGQEITNIPREEVNIENLAVIQSGCEMRFDFADFLKALEGLEDGFDPVRSRRGNISGNVISISEVLLIVEAQAGLIISKNTYSATGIISGNQIDFSGSGELSGSFEGTSFSITFENNLSLQRKTGGGDIFGGISIGNDWYSSSWFGSYNKAASPWIWHDEHGWMFTTSNASNNIWYWTTDMGWLWTSNMVYPFIFRQNENSWLWYVKGSKNPRWFFNYVANQWFNDSDKKEITVELVAVADAYVNSSNIHQNYGKEQILYTGSVARGSAGTSRYISFIKFDLSSIPNNVEITDARLHLITGFNNSIIKPVATVQVLAQVTWATTINWTEDNITYFDIGSFTTYLDQRFVTFGVTDTYSWNVKLAVQRWINGEIINRGFQVKSYNISTEGGAFCGFYSRDIFNTPVLVVKYRE